MKHYRLFLHFLLLLLLSQPVAGQQLSGNPLTAEGRPFQAADPDIKYFNGRYYIYPTGGSNFFAASSADLVTWRDEGHIFDLRTQCNWADKDGWAPDVVYRNHLYYFYYSAEQKIGVAAGPTPTGPFTDLGRPLIGTDPLIKDIIDPHVFVDDNGRAYLYYGGSSGNNDKKGGRLIVRELNSDMVSFASGPVEISPPGYTEAPVITKRGGIYHLTYSNGSYADATYNVQYSTGYSPTGPWIHRGTLLSSNAQYQGPGHHAIIQIPECDEYYITYHRYQNNNFNDQRYIALERLQWGKDGLIQPVKMTSYGVAARVPGGACQVTDLVSGGVYKLTHKGTAQCLTVAGPDARQDYDNGSSAQRWQVTLEADGSYKLKNKSTGQCLAAPGTTAGVDVVTESDNGQANQRWDITHDANGFYKLKHQGTNQVLDAAGGAVTPGNVIQYDDYGSNAQRWQLELVDIEVRSGSTYTLTHQGTDQRLDMAGNDARNGYDVIQYTAHNSNAQHWVITSDPTAPGYYKLRVRGTGQYLNVADNNPNPGADVIHWSNTNSDAQRWSIEYTGDGYVKLKHKGTNHVLDVAGGDPRPGANVIQYQDQGGHAQRWRLELTGLTSDNLDPVLTSTNTNTLAQAVGVEQGAAGLQAYPNPASTGVTFSFVPRGSGEASLDLYSATGQLVRHLALQAKAGELSKTTLSTEMLPIGLYTARLVVAGATQHCTVSVVH